MKAGKIKRLFKYASVILHVVIPSFIKVQAPNVLDNASVDVVLRSILSSPTVLNRIELVNALPKASLKTITRPGLLLTTGSVKVLNELERFTGIK